MIPYDIDPSLHAGQPEPPRLDDGFSPPVHEEPPALQSPDHHVDVDPVLWAKSPF